LAITERERIARLEKVVGTLIAWMPRELGGAAQKELLRMLTTDPDDKIGG